MVGSGFLGGWPSAFYVFGKSHPREPLCKKPHRMDVVSDRCVGVYLVYWLVLFRLQFSCWTSAYFRRRTRLSPSRGSIRENQGKSQQRRVISYENDLRCSFCSKNSLRGWRSSPVCLCMRSPLCTSVIITSTILSWLPYQRISPLFWILTCTRYGSSHSLTSSTEFRYPSLSWAFQNGFLFALPYLAQMISTLIIGRIVDRLRTRKTFSITVLRKGQTLIGRTTVQATNYYS